MTTTKSTPMKVWAVLYENTSFPEDLYERALAVMDLDSAARIKRFYHRADACRTLIGRLLTRRMLNQRGIPLIDMSFSTTDAGKPYVSCVTDPPIAYNVTHDNALIALAFAPGRFNGPAFNVGIDVMKVRVPGRQGFPAFVETFRDQLTALERGLLRDVPQEEAVRRFFWMWTMKEAYTKALGLGLGFDFSRVEFDVIENTVRVDGQIPQGWWFGRFVIKDGQDTYEGVVAELVGGGGTVVTPETQSPDWLHIFDAATFTEKTIQELQPQNPT